MSLRKNSMTGSIPATLAPRLGGAPLAKQAAVGVFPGPPNVGQHPTVPVMSKEYIDALAVLSDETMSKACSLLLSERDYNQQQTSREESTTQQSVKKCEKSDYEQLDDLIKRCREAAEVIRKEEELLAKSAATVAAKGAMPPPGLPTMPSIPGGRERAGSMAGLRTTIPSQQQQKGIVGPNKPTPNALGSSAATAVRPRGISMGTSRLSASALPSLLVPANSNKRDFGMIERQISDSSFPSAGGAAPTTAASGGGTFNNNINKKPRKLMKQSSLTGLVSTGGSAPCMSPILDRKMKFPQAGSAASSGESISKNVMECPPPNALNFLAKLNKEANISKAPPPPPDHARMTTESENVATTTSSKDPDVVDNNDSNKKPSSPQRILPPRGSRK